MGEVRTEITLVNLFDRYAAEDGRIPKEQVRRLTVNAVVDTDAWDLCINEETRQKLGLKVEETCELTLPSGEKVPCQITEPVIIHWKDRDTPCKALVIPGEEGVIIGKYPLFGMDLMVHPESHEVVGAHGDKRRSVVK